MGGLHQSSKSIDWLRYPNPNPNPNDPSYYLPPNTTLQQRQQILSIYLLAINHPKPNPNPIPGSDRIEVEGVIVEMDILEAWTRDKAQGTFTYILSGYG